MKNQERIFEFSLLRLQYSSLNLRSGSARAERLRKRNLRKDILRGRSQGRAVDFISRVWETRLIWSTWTAPAHALMIQPLSDAFCTLVSMNCGPRSLKKTNYVFRSSRQLCRTPSFAILHSFRRRNQNGSCKHLFCKAFPVLEDHAWRRQTPEINLISRRWNIKRYVCKVYHPWRSVVVGRVHVHC